MRRPRRDSEHYKNACATVRALTHEEEARFLTFTALDGWRVDEAAFAANGTPVALRLSRGGTTAALLSGDARSLLDALDRACAAEEEARRLREQLLDAEATVRTLSRLLDGQEPPRAIW